MDIFKLKEVVLFGVMGIVGLLFGLYIAIVGEVPSIIGNGPLIEFDGIDILMGIYPFGLGLFFCFKAKWEYENNADNAA